MEVEGRTYMGGREEGPPLLGQPTLGGLSSSSALPKMQTYLFVIYVK